MEGLEAIPDTEQADIELDQEGSDLTTKVVYRQITDLGNYAKKYAEKNVAKRYKVEEPKDKVFIVEGSDYDVVPKSRNLGGGDN